ncbi:pre-mRNA-splicing factor SYF2-like [Anneissia japonica]|uniref:pre-mRNA-splicing factor SYF2-like n=1 Tax=Anneissia japonica TaxID=1529436 RepID=UPI00142572B4|nr:pre-mRNA-splicing factor SYF2-like [Anneissia japonica]XP_033121301.1 pre-mRNA-splicing factor SYF2-like [Anneissia japonica]XP_033121302.1 pre-mRNA-splicing factor SYF2-like [Anneissia japonica]
MCDITTNSSMQAASTKPSTSEVSAKDKKAERMKKLRELHLKRNEARKLNHAEVVEEDRKAKLPSNWEARKRQADWILQDDEKRKNAEEKGLDYDRLKLLDVTAEEAERIEKKKKKKNADPGFSDYEQATFRQYQRLTKQMKPNMEDYERKKEKMGEDMFPTVNSLMQGEHKDSEEAIDRMVTDLEKQIDRRGKFSRRRMHNEDNDIDYINERNKKFNEKAERFYGKYTAEIKQNLERGTAV